MEKPLYQHLLKLSTDKNRGMLSGREFEALAFRVAREARMILRQFSSLFAAYSDLKKRDTLAQILKEFYVREINITIESFWGAGWYVKIGDKINGYRHEEPLESVNNLEQWLLEYLQKLPPLTEVEKKHIEG